MSVDTTKLKVGDKIRVRVVSSTRDSDSAFAIGKEYDAIIESVSGYYGIGFRIPKLGAYCLEIDCSHLNGGCWEVIE